MNVEIRRHMPSYMELRFLLGLIDKRGWTWMLGEMQRNPTLQHQGRDSDRGHTLREWCILRTMLAYDAAARRGEKRFPRKSDALVTHIKQNGGVIVVLEGGGDTPSAIRRELTPDEARLAALRLIIAATEAER